MQWIHFKLLHFAVCEARVRFFLLISSCLQRTVTRNPVFSPSAHRWFYARWNKTVHIATDSSLFINSDATRMSRHCHPIYYYNSKSTKKKCFPLERGIAWDDVVSIVVCSRHVRSKDYETFLRFQFESLQARAVHSHCNSISRLSRWNCKCLCTSTYSIPFPLHVPIQATTMVQSAASNVV